MMKSFSHVDQQGKAKMVDVSQKPVQKRTAVATGKIFLMPETIGKVREMSLKKGDVLAVSKIAGIQAAKSTSLLIPLCHNIRLEMVDLSFDFSDDCITITACVVCSEKTGAEMEALTATTISALTIYDMCKAVDKTMRIGDISLVQKQKEDV
jgi:cyclic pyranopterin phosphate synthase